MSGSVRQYVLRRQDLLYPELSFKINGVLFDVFKQLGGNHQERYYQKAVAAGLAEESLPFLTKNANEGSTGWARRV